MKRLILIDSHAIIHRAYHALPPLTSPSGEPTNAVYGFTTILMRMLKELKPDYIAACFDMAAPTFRHIAYERYKAQRPETPGDLSRQFVMVKEVLAAFDIPVLEKEGYEADDIIGTVAEKFKHKKDLEIIVVTGDLDTLQLVRPRLKVYSMKKGISETAIYDERAVRERYGLKPSQLVDFKGLKGDPSDNIPGVKGIGEKTAAELIRNFGSIEGVYKALKAGNKKISKSVAEKLRAGEEDAKFSKELAAINLNVPLDVRLEEFRREKKDEEKITTVFQKYGFLSLLKRLNEERELFKPGLRKLRRPGQDRSPVSQPELLRSESQSIFREEVLKTLTDFQKFERGVQGTDCALLLWEGELYSALEGSETLYRWSKKLFSEKEVRRFFEERGHFVFDGKAIIHFLRGFGIELGRIIFDAAIASYLAGTFLRDFSYPAVAARELGRMISQDPRQEFVRFFEIVRSLRTKLAAGRIREVFERIELPLIRILADMEGRGIKVDVEFLKKLSQEIDGRLGVITEEIYKLTGESFNINSPQQLSVVLFEKLNLTARGLRKTAKAGRISTGAAELEKLKGSHPAVEKILEYRELMKLKTTYVDALPPLVNPQTRRLHTTFNQTGTATGRLSSSEPNLQNIPIMSELGREIRKAFVAEDGYALVSFDYSQIELRVAAHLADDEKMIEAFRRGLDIHKMTAAEIFNVSLEKVTPEQRRAAKTLNFGILYGMGPQALAEATGMSKDEAKKFIDEYFRDFSGIKKYIENTLRFAEENGYVETLFGRRRYIPEIHSPNWQLKREAERMAVNMPVQGTATGDIIKLAMIKVDEWVRKEKLEDDVRMLLQVHDELLFEINKKLLSERAHSFNSSPLMGEDRRRGISSPGIVANIKKIMESAAELKIPLVVDVKAGKNWGEQKEI